MKHSIQIMGILNITPDSFYEKSRYLDINDIEKSIKEMEDADIIDIGCESSRPGAKPISTLKEMKRLDSALPFVKEYSSINFSIDTCKYEVAEYALKNGFKILNDINGGRTNGIFELVAKHNASIIIMHMKGTPVNMQKKPRYSNVIDQICDFFDTQIKKALSAGISKDSIIIDPGIGFGKTIQHNFDIIRNIEIFKDFGYKVLYGISRKSFLQYKNDMPINRLPASLGLTAHLFSKKLDIIRTHDVVETKSMLSILKKIGK